MPHCQICLTESPNHAPFCPVATGEPVRGYSVAQDSQAICTVCGGRNGIHNWAGPGTCPGAQYDRPQVFAFNIQALQAQIMELRERVRQLELKLKERGAR